MTIATTMMTNERVRSEVARPMTSATRVAMGTRRTRSATAIRPFRSTPAPVSNRR